MVSVLTALVVSALTCSDSVAGAASWSARDERVRFADSYGQCIDNRYIFDFLAYTGRNDFYRYR